MPTNSQFAKHSETRSSRRAFTGAAAFLRSGLGQPAPRRYGMEARERIERAGGLPCHTDGIDYEAEIDLSIMRRFADRADWSIADLRRVPCAREARSATGRGAVSSSRPCQHNPRRLRQKARQAPIAPKPDGRLARSAVGACGPFWRSGFTAKSGNAMKPE